MLPAALDRFFWDLPAASLDREEHARFIIERLLEYGDADAVVWVWRTYGAERIRNVVRHSRRLSPKTAVAWARYPGLEEVEVCSLLQPSPTTSWRC